jgi:hypothetical protein
MGASMAKTGATGVEEGRSVLTQRGASDIAWNFTRNPGYLQECQTFFVFFTNASIMWSQSGMRSQLRPQSGTFVVTKWGICPKNSIRNQRSIVLQSTGLDCDWQRSGNYAISNKEGGNLRKSSFQALSWDPQNVKLYANITDAIRNDSHGSLLSLCRIPSQPIAWPLIHPYVDYNCNVVIWKEICNGPYEQEVHDLQPTTQSYQVTAHQLSYKQLQWLSPTAQRSDILCLFHISWSMKISLATTTFSWIKIIKYPF